MEKRQGCSAHIHVVFFFPRLRIGGKGRFPQNLNKFDGTNDGFLPFNTFNWLKLENISMENPKCQYIRIPTNIDLF